MLVQAPGLARTIVHGSTPHIAAVFIQEWPVYRPVHGTSIIPNNQIAHALPINTQAVPILSTVHEELVEYLLRFLRGQAFDMMNMGGDV